MAAYDLVHIVQTLSQASHQLQLQGKSPTTAFAAVTIIP
jgi:hypothetical protein